MKKPNRERDMLLQRKTEKQRLRKQTKPRHDHVFATGVNDEPTLWEKITHFLSRQVPEEKAVLDRRERRAIKRGNR